MPRLIETKQLERDSSCLLLAVRPSCSGNKVMGEGLSFPSQPL